MDDISAAHSAMISEDDAAPPSVDKYGLPLNCNSATPTTCFSHNTLGESSNNRSVDVQPLNLQPPPLQRNSVLSVTDVSRRFHNLKYPVDSVNGNSQHDFFHDISHHKTWKIQDGSIKCVPGFPSPSWPLDPMSKVVIDSNPQEIAFRISECLHCRSINATFEKAKAKCISKDNVEFRIRLYACSVSLENGIIVEIQRRKGWSTSYFEDCIEILKSAEGKSGWNKGSIEGNVGIASPGDIKYDMEVSDHREEATLELVEILFKSNTYCSTRFAMESLLSLSDRNKCGKLRSEDTAFAIFFKDGKVDVKKILYGLVVKGNMILDRKVQCSDSDISYFRDLAIMILSNALSSFSESLRLQALYENKWIGRELVSTLTREINNSTLKPYVAANAARRLNDIIEISCEATSAAINAGALDILTMD